MTTQAVVVIDDDEGVRDSLLTLFAQHGLEVRAFASAADFLRWVRPDTAAVIVTDIRMPEIDGMQLIERLKAAQCGQPVIVMTGHGDVPLAVKAMKAGVFDFFEKPFESEPLIASVRAAIDSLDSSFDEKAYRAAIAERIALLSLREEQVLRELVEGKSNKMIAQALAISPRTVEIYRANVMAKMRAGSLSELVRMSIATRAV
ncbi:MAG: response regulator [Alphaproteobacteria bacterium]|nr:response regulator [Alphaproteobacteria bacterium]